MLFAGAVEVGSLEANISGIIGSGVIYLYAAPMLARPDGRVVLNGYGLGMQPWKISKSSIFGLKQLRTW